MARDWIKLHKKLRTHPRILQLTPAERWAYVCLLIEADIFDGEFENQQQLDHILYWERRHFKRLREVGLLEGLRVHGWEKAQAPTDASAGRRQALHRDADLRARVRERDGDICRYCGITVQWTDRRGPNGGTYDHVDPAGPNVLWNLAVACRGCNASKGDRRLDAWSGRPDLRPDLDPDLNQELSPPPTASQVRPTPEKRRVEEKRTPSTPPEPEAVEKVLAREEVRRWLTSHEHQDDYRNADRLCVSRGYPAEVVIAALEMVEKYHPDRPLVYIQGNGQEDHSSALSKQMSAYSQRTSRWDDKTGGLKPGTTRLEAHDVPGAIQQLADRMKAPT